MDSFIRIDGLEPIIRRFNGATTKVNSVIKTTMETALLKIWELVPPYPRKPRASKYIRTGTLGRSLGSGESGGKMGSPDIKQVTQMGSYTEGKFGTALNYAHWVIGEQQAWMHRGRWWRLPVEVLNKAKPEVIKLFDAMKDELTKYLDGRGL